MNEETHSRLFREVNERIAAITGTWQWEDVQGFLCECARADCTEAVELTRAQWEAIRALPSHYVTVPGHERPGVERVIERRDSFVVVAASA